MLTNKFYIGKHSSLFIDDNYFGSGHHLKRAIKKYGKNNFKRDIIEFCDNEALAYKREIEILSIYYGDELCYNISKGGNGVMNGRVLTEKHKNKISKALVGRKKPPRSIEHINNMNFSRRRRRSPVYQIDRHTDKILNEFASIFEAEKWINRGGRAPNIHACLKGNRNTAYGYKWKLI